MFDTFFDPTENLAIEVEELKVEVSREQERVKFLSGENSWLREQIKDLTRSKFGKKSERWETEEQYRFDEVEVESKKADFSGGDEDSCPETKVEGHTRKRGHRRPLPEDLDREVVKVELPLGEQVAKDGSPLKVIGWEISEKLKYEPAKTSVVEYHRAKYGVDSGDYEKTAPPVPCIIEKGIATAELLAAIVVGKYADGLPLYRMEDIFLRSGVDLSRGTMARWMIKVAQACQPIWNVLSDRLHEAFYVACDETHTQVLKENGRKAESKSWMWVRSTPYDLKKIILFDYSPSRSGEVAKNLFSDFEGYLQCDGLGSYNCLESEKVVRIGCNMHARRRFEKATVTGAKPGQSLGAKGLEFYKKIYALEEEIRNLAPEEKFRIRRERAQPPFEEMKVWADVQAPKVPAKSKIGQAIAYFSSEYEYLTGYLKDGRLDPDNGFTERAIRKFAIGRNNWMCVPRRRCAMAA